MLRLRLLRDPSVRERATFDSGRAVLVGYRLCGVGGRGDHRFSVGGRQLRVALGFLVAALGAPFDCGRLLEGEVGAIGLGFGAAGPSL